MSCARGALGGEPAVVHHHQAVAELLGLVHVVGGDDQGDPLLLEPVEAVPQEVAGLGVEAGGRLVEDQQLRLGDEGPGDGEPALHPPRQRLDLVVGPVGQLGELEQPLGPFADDLAGGGRSSGRRSSGCRGRSARGRGCPPGGRGRSGPGCGPVGGRVHARAPAACPPLTGDMQAIIRMVEVLPAPFGPEEAERLAPGDLEVDAVDGHEVAEALDEPAGQDQRAGVLAIGRCGRVGGSCRSGGHRRFTLPADRDAHVRMGPGPGDGPVAVDDPGAAAQSAVQPRLSVNTICCWAGPAGVP